MFTFVFFAMLAGLCWIGYDYFSSSKSGQAKIRSDFGFGGPFDEPGDSEGFSNETSPPTPTKATVQEPRFAELPRKVFLDGTFLRKYGYYGNPLW